MVSLSRYGLDRDKTSRCCASCGRWEVSPESPAKRAYRFLGMAPPWIQTWRESVRLPRRRSRGARGANLPQPDRGARIHDVLRTQVVPRRGGAPRASAALVGTATVVGHFIPLSPFFFVGSDALLGAVLAIVLSGIALFGIGWYEAKITVGSWWREGLEMLVIGLGGGVAGDGIGRLVGAAEGAARPPLASTKAHEGPEDGADPV